MIDRVEGGAGVAAVVVACVFFDARIRIGQATRHIQTFEPCVGIQGIDFHAIGAHTPHIGHPLGAGAGVQTVDFDLGKNRIPHGFGEQSDAQQAGAGVFFSGQLGGFGALWFEQRFIHKGLPAGSCCCRGRAIQLRHRGHAHRSARRGLQHPLRRGLKRQRGFGRVIGFVAAGISLGGGGSDCHQIGGAEIVFLVIAIGGLP